MGLALAAIAVAIGGLAQTTTGFGFSLVAAPFLVTAFAAPGGVQLNLVLSSILNLAILITDWRQVRPVDLLWMLVPAAAVVLVLSPVIRGADRGPLTVGAGVFILAGVVVLARGIKVRAAAGRGGAVGAGAMSGAMTVIAGAGGPPVVLYTVNAGWAPMATRATLQAFFLSLNFVALLGLGVPRRIPLVLPIAMAVGLLVGRAIAGRVPESRIRKATLVLAFAGGLLAIARGLTG